MTTGEVVAREVVVHGLVQGVFFRASCAEEAARLGVRGWVRNEPDGTVAGHVEGSAEAVEAILAWCRRGPRRAHVTGVDVTVVAPRGAVGFQTG